MTNIAEKPYFLYNDIIQQLMMPLSSQAHIEFLGHSRVFTDRDRFQICAHKDWSVDFYQRELYRHGIYEKPIHELASSFNMWDHMPYAPPEIYVHTRKIFHIAHGLTIVQNHGNYVDSFVFATYPGNTQINNFYLNQKHLFDDFVKNFYIEMAKILDDLKNHTFSIPLILNPIQTPPVLLTPRQRDCALLLATGSGTKEIAHTLAISPRTVEYHIDTLREKFQARNRADLMYALSQRGSSLG